MKEFMKHEMFWSKIIEYEKNENEKIMKTISVVWNYEKVIE